MEKSDVLTRADGDCGIILGVLAGKTGVLTGLPLFCLHFI